MTDLEELERLAKDSVEKRAGLHKARGVQTVARAQSASFEANCAFGNLASPRLILALLEERKRLLAALNASKGYMLNAKIDLQTGTKKATTINTLEGGLRMVEAAIAAVEIKPEEGK